MLRRPSLKPRDDRIDVFEMRPHADPHGPHREIGKHRVDLRGHEISRDLMDASDASGVLRGQRRDDGGAVDAKRGKRLQVGLDAGAARRIRAGDGERDGRRHRTARMDFSSCVGAMACPSAACYCQQVRLPRRPVSRFVYVLTRFLHANRYIFGATHLSETTAMVPFFVQFKCKLGQSYAVANALAEAEIASEIYSTAGDYDLLVKFYVDNDTDIGHFVNEKVQVIPGIQDTHTIITFKAFGTG